MLIGPAPYSPPISQATPEVSVSQLKRSKELEAENAKLKRMGAELAFENIAIKGV